MRDFSEDLADVARRVADAHAYLRVDEARKRLSELEEQASAPDLWNDADHARKVTSELSRVRDDVQLVDDLERRASELKMMFDLGREEDDDSFEQELEDGLTAPAGVRRLGPARVELTLHEGRKHQVKRMLAAVGHPVTRLHRSRYAGLEVSDLQPGRARDLEPAEVATLRARVRRPR